MTKCYKIYSIDANNKVFGFGTYAETMNDEIATSILNKHIESLMCTKETEEEIKLLKSKRLYKWEEE